MNLTKDEARALQHATRKYYILLLETYGNKSKRKAVRIAGELMNKAYKIKTK